MARAALLVATVAGAVAASGLAAAKDKASKPAPPPTKQTQVIRAETYKGMEAAQKAYEAKDYKGALALLDTLRLKEAKLNDYERASLYNFYAVTWYALENPAKTVESHLLVLKQPNLPDGLRDSSYYALAQLYFIGENYANTIQVVQKWLSLLAEPSPDAHALLAQAYYQTQKYPEAEKALVTSMNISKDRGQAPKEAALALLRAIYYERKEYVKAAKVLEFLAGKYPDKASYWQQLAGMKGLLDQQREQLNLMHAAYRVRMLKTESDLLNLARLYMVQEVPYPAVRVLTQGFKHKTIRVTTENLQLYAQALAMAKEYRQQIPVLRKLAEMTGEARHYTYLGQAYNETGDWDSAIAAFRAALRARNLDKPGDAQMQLGTALFNAKKYSEARESFVAAAATPSLAEAAHNWTKFVDQEVARREAVQDG